MPKSLLCSRLWSHFERQEIYGRSRKFSNKNYAVIHKYQGTWIFSVHRTKREGNHKGFPDACDKGPESWIFKVPPPDEKSKGVAGNIKVRWTKFLLIPGHCSVYLTRNHSLQSFSFKTQIQSYLRCYKSIQTIGFPKLYRLCNKCMYKPSYNTGGA